MLAYICDRCGKVIPRPKGTADKPIKRVIDWGISNYDDPSDGGEVKQIDVCNACYSSFLDWLHRWQTIDPDTEDNNI